MATHTPFLKTLYVSREDADGEPYFVADSNPEHAVSIGEKVRVGVYELVQTCDVVCDVSLVSVNK